MASYVTTRTNTILEKTPLRSAWIPSALHLTGKAKPKQKTHDHCTAHYFESRYYRQTDSTTHPRSAPPGGENFHVANTAIIATLANLCSSRIYTESNMPPVPEDLHLPHCPAHSEAKTCTACLAYPPIRQAGIITTHDQASETVTCKDVACLGACGGRKATPASQPTGSDGDPP